MELAAAQDLFGHRPHHGEEWGMGVRTAILITCLSAPQISISLGPSHSSLASTWGSCWQNNNQAMVFVLKLQPWNESKVHKCQSLRKYHLIFAHPKVFKQAFWMRGWGSKTAKRTCLWSNSSAIRFFATAKKYGRIKSKRSVPLADSYFDGNGRKRFKGNSRLRQSQSIPQILGGYNLLIDSSHIYMRRINRRLSILTPKKQPIYQQQPAEGISNWIWKTVRYLDESLQEGSCGPKASEPGLLIIILCVLAQS